MARKKPLDRTRQGDVQVGLPPIPNAEKSEQSGALNRGLRILSAVVAAERPMGLSDISAAVDLAPATVHRLLQSLVSGRYLYCDDAGRFCPMPKTVSPLGSLHPLVQLRQGARSILAELQKKHGPTAALNVIMGTARLVVDYVAAENQFLPYIDTDLRTPLHASTSGKLLLSDLPLERCVEILGPGPYKAFTEHTITAPATLFAQFEDVKRLGYASNFNEHMQGITSIGAPIFAASGKILGSIVLSGASHFFREENVEQIKTDVKQAAYLFSFASPAMRAVARFIGK